MVLTTAQRLNYLLALRAFQRAHGSLPSGKVASSPTSWLGFVANTKFPAECGTDAGQLVSTVFNGQQAEACLVYVRDKIKVRTVLRVVKLSDCSLSFLHLPLPHLPFM
jgi:hypothetical protein